MATSDVIADAGRTLQHYLSAALSPAVNVIVSTPDDFKSLGQQPTLTVFLYHVSINAELRNGPHVSAGNTLARPALPLELRYLVTPWVSNTTDAHAVVGTVLQTLYDRASLGPGELQGSSWGPDDSAQVHLESLPVNEHYSIWEPTELPYRLSLTYLMRVLGLEPGVVETVTPVISAQLGGA